jgi:lipid A disaccharide synthetase
MGNWQWFDDINKTDWEPKQIALLLCILPFEKNSWDRASSSVWYVFTLVLFQ